MQKFWLPVWPGPRALWALGIVAMVFIVAGAVPSLTGVAAGALVAVVLAMVLDAIVGPRFSQLSVERIGVEHFALRVTGHLRYRIINRSNQLVRAGIIEPPVEALHYERDEIDGVIPPRSSLELERAVTPLMRGEVRFGSVYVWVENSIGLLRRRLRIALEETIRVYPDLSAVERYGNLHLRNRLIEAGLRKMRLRGVGTEFESLREWGSGDPFRNIDWKATARRGKIMVAQHEVERSQNIMLLLDCGRLMTPRLGEQRKFDYVITAALSIATIASLANDRVGFVAFANDILFASAPRPSRVALAQTSEKLYALEPRFEESDYSRAFGYVRSHLNKRSLIVLFTDMFDPVASATILAEIRILARRHLVVCVFMNDEAIDRALHGIPREPLDVYRAGVAVVLAEERRAARTALAKFGVRVVDAPAAKLSVTLIDAYLY